MKNLLYVVAGLVGAAGAAQAQLLDGVTVVVERHVDAASLASVPGLDIAGANQWLEQEAASMEANLTRAGAKLRAGTTCLGSMEECEARRITANQQYARTSPAAFYAVAVLTAAGVVVVPAAYVGPVGLDELALRVMEGGCRYGPQRLGIGFGYVPPLLLPRNLPHPPTPAQLALGLKHLAETFSPRHQWREYREAVKRERRAPPKRH